MALEMSVTEARDRFSDVIATSAREPVFLTRRGRRESVVISSAEYDRLCEAQEETEDQAAADAAMREIMIGAPRIPWERVKADLGLA